MDRPTCPSCAIGALRIEHDPNNRVNGRAACARCGWVGRWKPFDTLVCLPSWMRRHGPPRRWPNPTPLAEEEVLRRLRDPFARLIFPEVAHFPHSGLTTP